MAKSTKIATILKKLEKTKKKDEQIELLRELQRDQVAKEIIIAALNPYVTYGVKPKKPGPITKPADIDEAIQWEWEWMASTLHALATRRLTGKAAREQIEKSSRKCRPILDRILKKDLRCGVHAKTINMVYPGLIPMFEVALADEGFVIIDGKIVQRVPVEYPVWAEPKYDGMRCIAMTDGKGGVELKSRKGKPFNNFLSVTEAVRFFSAAEEVPFIFDGEVYGETFKEVTEVAQCKDGSKTDERLAFRVWDMMRRDHFLQQVQLYSLQQRQQTLATLVRDGNRKLMRTPGRMVNSEEEMLEVFLQMRVRGLEGLILKPLHLPYSFKRDRSWIKVKEMFTGEFKVTGFIEGEGKYAGVLGAIEIDVDGVEVDVGSGFKDAERADIWKHKKKYLGCYAEIKYQEKTDDGSLRFPTFLRWRPDKDMDEE